LSIHTPQKYKSEVNNKNCKRQASIVESIAEVCARITLRTLLLPEIHFIRLRSICTIGNLDLKYQLLRIMLTELPYPNTHRTPYCPYNKYKMDYHKKPQNSFSVLESLNVLLIHFPFLGFRSLFTITNEVISLQDTTQRLHLGEV